jgi:hypothetical protein
MSEPVRWLSGAEPLLHEHEREALRALANAGPDLKQRTRTLARLEQLTAAPPTPAAGTAALRSHRWWGWIAGTLAIVLLGASAFLRQSAPSPAVPSSHARPTALPTHTSEDRSPSVEPQPSPAIPEPDAPRALGAPARPAPHSASAASDLAPRDPAAELALLTPARQLLVVDPARALALADEHARRYQRGVFREERAFLRIEALVRLGRRTAAEREARAFLRAHPGSTYQQRLQQVLAAAP